MDVNNTLLILARLLNVNQLLCPEWVSDTAQCVNKNHVLCDRSLCAVGSRIMNESQHELESRPHSSLCAGEWVPACTLTALFAEDSRVSRGSSTPGRHACGWAQLNWERNESVHEVIPFSPFTQNICSFKRHVHDRHNTTLLHLQLHFWILLIEVISYHLYVHCAPTEQCALFCDHHMDSERTVYTTVLI